MDRFDWLEFDSTPAVAEKTLVVRASGSTTVLPGPPPPAMPSDGPTFYRAAREMRAAGHMKAATDFYRRAVGYDDKDYTAWTELIDTLVRAGRLDEADEVSLEAHTNFQRVRVLYAARALTLAHRGRFEEALPLSNISVEEAKPHWYAQAVRGEIYLRMNPRNRASAIKLFELAASMAAQPWEAYLIAGWALLDGGWPALAAGPLSEAAHLNPRAPNAWLCLGDAFHALKLYDQALFYYQRVTELEPSHELALERQRMLGSLRYSVLRALRIDVLRGNWRTRFDKALAEQLAEQKDFEI